MTRILSTLLLAVLSVGSAQAACQVSEAGDVDIYPTAEVLPENLLRVYVYFPRPMGRGDVLSHVAILDDAGEPVEGAFLSSRYDLWSPDRRRVTLLLDPGRVKTGLDAHVAMGRALVAGRTYNLVVDGAAMDAEGCALGQDIVHRFEVGPADLDPPTPSEWTLAAPRVGSIDPLTLDLGSPHDHLSLAFRLRVRGADGTALRGRIELGGGEAVWHFVPEVPWQAGPHAITVDARLEDLAGNRPGQLFDRPPGAAPQDWAEELPFQPIAASP